MCLCDRARCQQGRIGVPSAVRTGIQAAIRDLVRKVFKLRQFDECAKDYRAFQMQGFDSGTRQLAVATHALTTHEAFAA